jgi:hypothetical protein
VLAGRPIRGAGLAKSKFLLRGAVLRSLKGWREFPSGWASAVEKSPAGREEPQGVGVPCGEIYRGGCPL